MAWHALTLEIDARAAEALSERLLEEGAQSVSIDRPDTALASLEILVGLDNDPVALLGRAAASSGMERPPPFVLGRVEDEDWVSRTQAQFEPVSIGARLWIGASWHARPERRLCVCIDPGLAFGTGSHPTTRLVLDFLDSAIRGGERVLDYGCGSGILAIAAARLGATRVDAVDIDPQAVATTAANAAANGVRVRASAPEALAPATYDVLVSNILAQPLIVLAPLLAVRAAPHARLALSGVLSQQADEVAAAYARWFSLRASRSEGGWALLEGERR
jgi:ribosomal protein L11 methyltransferase